MLFESLILIFFIVIVGYAIANTIRDLKLIELNAQILARQKQPKQERFEFIEDETDNPYLATNDEELDETLFM